MESLNLNGLAKSLPAANFEKAEKDLLNNFKAAALSITTLYRSSRHASKRAYNAGYATACQDLLMMIQQGVSTGGMAPSTSNRPDSNEMTIGRIMDWIEARLEAVRSREEEEDEDEEKEKEKERGRLAPTGNNLPKDTSTTTFSAGPSQKTTPEASSHLTRTTTEKAPAAPLTPHSPYSLNSANLPPRLSSPSPPLPTPARPTNHPHAGQRPLRTRALGARKEPADSFTNIHPPISTSLVPSSENVFRVPSFKDVPATALSHTESDLSDFAAGAKRRHAVMMMLDSTVASAGTETSSPSSSNVSPANHPSSGSNGTRRRTRGTRHSASQTQVQTHQLGESMDVEEDGRERKRVARR
ncbi:hypothetical protein BJ138DRAFT_1135114 [Hygrophoropsis aurantiaca]|uniref:Uncharacterized protein n=1 Tax=Hygrophoropsis aurantiaca TaxID=72124 RepID=A0ACB8AF80_9AGAM|nr:hypothetical protein BJ138DRAFT_1135114 [Hygrophoropsis aurantiaca]